MTIVPIHPRDLPADMTQPAGVQRVDAASTLDRGTPSRRSFGKQGPSHRLFGYRGPSVRGL